MRMKMTKLTCSTNTPRTPPLKKARAWSGPSATATTWAADMAILELVKQEAGNGAGDYDRWYIKGHDGDAEIVYNDIGRYMVSFPDLGLMTDSTTEFSEVEVILRRYC